MKNSEIKFPFLYFGHGTAYADKSIFCSIIFKNKIKLKELNFVKEKLPDPLIKKISMQNNCVSLYSSDAYDGEALKCAGEETEGEEFELWKEFESILESSLLEIHKRLPIISVYKTSNPYYGNRFSQWHFYSIENLFTVFLPALKKSLNDKKCKVDIADSIYSDLNFTLFGYVTAYMERKYPITAGNVIELFELIGGKNNFITGKEDKSFILSTASVLIKLLGRLNERDHNKYFNKLPIAIRVKIITGGKCEYLFTSDKLLDRNKYEKLLNEAKPEEEKYISDLYSELLACDMLKLRKNLVSKKFVLNKAAEFINTNNLTEALAVNLLFSIINSNLKDRREFSKLEDKLKELISEREDISKSEHVKKNLALI